MAAETFTDRHGFSQDAEEVAARLACPDCPGEVRRTGWRFRVIHQESCPSWRLYQRRLPGYTALPSGAIVLAGEPAPKGEALVSNRGPSGPCGTSVTHRGPYRRRAAGG